MVKENMILPVVLWVSKIMYLILYMKHDVEYIYFYTSEKVPVR